MFLQELFWDSFEEESAGVVFVLEGLRVTHTVNSCFT